MNCISDYFTKEGTIGTTISEWANYSNSGTEGKYLLILLASRSD